MSFNKLIGIRLTPYVADQSAVAAINRALRGAASVHTTPVISLQFIIQAEKLDSIFLEDQGPHLGANGNLLEIC